MHDPFRYFNSAPEVIRLAVMMYVRSPLSLRQIEDLLCERGIDLCHETVRYWWHRVGPLCAAEIRTRRVHHRCYSLWRWHLDEVRVRINGKTHSRWRAVDHEGEVVEGVVTKRRDRRAALEFLQRAAEGIDAPICQDSRSRSQVCGLARSVVCHHALKDLAGEKAFETADDLPFGPPFSGASFDVVEGW